VTDVLKKYCFTLILSSLFLLLPVFAVAQEQNTDTEQADTDTARIQNGSDAAVDQNAKIADQMAKMQAELDNLKNELETDRAKHQEEMAKLKTEVAEDVEDQVFTAINENATDQNQSRFDIYGFFDMYLSHAFYDKGSYVGALIPNKTSFMMSRANIYFDSQMTENLNALLEVRFSFLPNGADDTYEIYVNGTHYNDTQYSRVDTTYRDPATSVSFKTGSIAIERVYLKYTPFDFLKIKAGRFLTPYGIWNVDHGSTVIISPVVPIAENHHLMPSAQTGVMVFGTFYPSDKVSLDYAFTVSNGRGPAESLFDLDSNKGIGLKLGMNANLGKLSMELGAYGYYGKYTDNKKTMYIENTSLESIKMTATEKYTEGAVAVHALLKVAGIRLQGEYIYKYAHYTYPSALHSDLSMFLPYNPEATAPDYNHHAVNALLGYTLPIKNIDTKIMPFATAERFARDDYGEPFNLNMYVAGINVKPSPYVVLKAAGTFAIPDNPELGKIQSIVGQLAVSF